MASLANDSINHFIETDLAWHNIAFLHCPKHAGSCKSPNSYIILNAKSGSRTILHTNLGLPELEYSDFENIQADAYSWVHFEGRPNIEEINKMMKKIHQLPRETKPQISLEMEKLNRNYEPLLDKVHVLFVSKEYAQDQGYENMTDFVQNYKAHLKFKLICAWGEKGAAARDEDGSIVHAEACKPSNGVIDTIGAGDTFNATVIACLNQGNDLSTALQTGCRVAGCKVGQFGFQGLKSVYYES